MIENADLSEAELARRRKDKIEYRIKKRNSFIFTLCATVFEIAVSFAIFFILFIAAAKILALIVGAEHPNFAEYILYASLVIIVLSIVIGFKLYKFTCRKIIKKYDLTNKLLDSVLYHYKTKAEIQEELDTGLRV